MSGSANSAARWNGYGRCSTGPSRKHARQYLRGLLAPIERKNGWTIAEHVGEHEPKALQRFLNLSPWSSDDLLELNREYVMEHFASPAGILVADPTGFAKKGGKSVGVQRQYSGTLGRVDNCQIATFLAYVTPDRDRVLIDRRLYLPEHSWMDDRDRCAEAGVPEDVTFQTRPQQVIDMIEHRACGRCAVRLVQRRRGVRAEPLWGSRTRLPPLTCGFRLRARTR